MRQVHRLFRDFYGYPPKDCVFCLALAKPRCQNPSPAGTNRGTRTPIRKPSGRQVRRRNLPSPRKRMKQAAYQIDQICVPESWPNQAPKAMH